MVTFAPNNPGIVYSPYNWDVTAVRAKTINSGAYFKTRVDGGATALTLSFDVTNFLTIPSQIWYRIDGYTWIRAVVAASIPMTIPTDTVGWAKHTVEVVMKSSTETENRWNDPQNTAVLFTGLDATGGSPTLTAPQKRSLNVIAYGDSITEGVLTIGSKSPQTDGNDVFGAWSWQMAESLGAEIGVIGFGATGLTKGGSGNVPQFSSSYDRQWGGASPVMRNFASPVPDAIVFMEGTNDGATSSISQVTAACNALLALTPATTPLVWLRPFNGTTQEANIKAGIAACTTPSRCFYVDTAGWYDGAEGLHPLGNLSKTSMGPRAAAAVRQALTSLNTTNNLYYNKNGTATALATASRKV